MRRPTRCVPLLCLFAVALLACGGGKDDPDGSSPTGATPGADAGASTGRHLNEIGVQLYTVRAAMEQDFEGTLRSLATMGYSEVEFAGLFEHDPTQVRQLLTELQLTPVGSHVTLDRFRDDPDAAITETLALGAEYMVFPWMPDTERRTLAQWSDLVATLERVGQSCRDRGIQLARQ